MARRLKTNAALILALVMTPLLGACASDNSPEDNSRPPTSTARPTDPAPLVPDTLDSEGAAQAEETAKLALSAFARKGLAYEAWWGELSPYLGPEALVAYEYTDPANVAAAAVTGDAVVSSAPSATQVTFLIPTDVGQYQVILNRQAVGGQWTVSRISPPEGSS